MTVISLMTDFGEKDGNAGVMHGVIYGINPEAKIVDLSHFITPQNIYEAGLILDRQTWYFPKGSIHVVVVDPGVGTHRRPIAAQIGDQFFVAPDNGVLSPLFERAQREGWSIKVVDTNKSEYWLNEISNVFHGRDIFSPVGAHLSKGIKLEDLGDIIEDYIYIETPKPQFSKGKIEGIVNAVDHFGNVISNIKAEHLKDFKNPVVVVKGQEVHPIVKTFGNAEIGTLTALIGSTGWLLVAKVNGNAAIPLGAQPGDTFTVIEKA